ncbi:MAG: DUF1624 domain-containing protein [Ignavibacteriales bacterium]|nr:DUF1624 domain-containing protein [Ignavibacteriales bacterium]
MKQTGRLQFIDLHRGLAILVMIEVHVFNAFLTPVIKAAPWFKTLNFVNGLVAPSFLFISGFAFILAAEKKIDDFRNFGTAFWKQLGRIGLIWFVGYTLRVPYFSLQKSIFESSEKQIAAFYSVDVLQTIAVGMLLLFGIRLFVKNYVAFKWIVVIIAILSGLLAPWFWMTDFHAMMHPFFANYFYPQKGSLFPLLPWIGFIFSGAWLSLLFTEARNRGSVQPFFKKVAIFSALMILFGHLFIAKNTALYLPLPDPHFFFFVMRVGYVMMILVACYIVSLKTDVSNWFFVDASRESLLVYWLHLQIIYRKWATGLSISDTINNSFGVWEGIAATIVLVALMVIVAIYWGRLKKYNKVIFHALLSIRINSFSDSI